MGTIQFRQVPINELFVSEEGYVCRKVSQGQATFVNFQGESDDPQFDIGELLPFASHEPVSLDLKSRPA